MVAAHGACRLNEGGPIFAAVGFDHCSANKATWPPGATPSLDTSSTRRSEALFLSLAFQKPIAKKLPTHPIYAKGKSATPPCIGAAGMISSMSGPHTASPT